MTTGWETIPHCRAARMVAANTLTATPRFALAYRRLSCSDSICSPLDCRSTRARDAVASMADIRCVGWLLKPTIKGMSENLKGTLRGADSKASCQLRTAYVGALGGADRRVTNVVTLPGSSH